MKKTTRLGDWVGLSVAEERYEIISRLGQGSMGYVYRACDRNLINDVVIKVPRQALLQDDPEYAMRFAKEVRPLVQLAHPHIVPVIDVGMHEDLPFVVLQYLPGGSLENRRPQDTNGRPLPVAPEHLCGYLLHVAETLDFVHAQGYLHRDVKPTNFLFDAYGQVYLSDFAIAKALRAPRQSLAVASLTGNGMVLGTPPYMAPELIMGESCDGRVDQYALAVVTYELLAGRLPFDGPNAAAIFVRQTTRPPPPLDSLRPGLAGGVSDAVHKALAKDPSERFPDCRTFARAVLDRAGATGAGPRPLRNTSLKDAGAAGQTDTISCPGCGRTFHVPRKAQQVKRLRCPRCQAVFAKPDQEREAVAEAPAPRPRHPTRPISQANIPPRPDRFVPRPRSTPEPEVQRGDYWRPGAEPVPTHGPGGLPVSLIAVLLMVVVAGVAVWAVWTKRGSPDRRRSTRFGVSAEADSSAKPSSLRLTVPKNLTLEAGKSAKLVVQVSHKGGDHKIDLKLTRLPRNVNLTGSTTVSVDGKAELVLTAAEDAEEEVRTVKLEARLERLVEIRQFTLTVVRPAALYLTVPQTVILEPGDPQPFEIAVKRHRCQGRVRLEIKGFAGPLDLIDGDRAQKSPATITVPAGQSTIQLTLKASGDANAMKAALKVTAQLGSCRDESKVQVQITDLWKVFTSSDAPFRVQLPGDPQRQRIIHKSALDGRETLECWYTLAAKKPVLASYVTSFVEGDIQKGGDQQVLDKELHKLIKRPQFARLFDKDAKVYEKRVQLHKRYSGWELLYGQSSKIPSSMKSTPSRFTRLRLYVVNQRVYYLIMVASKQVIDSPIAEKYFKSFTILDEGKQGK